MNDTAPAAASLIGQPVTALDTPALLVDLDVLEANIARVAAECRAHGVNWRPHIKGNKTIEIVRKEIVAGAIGVTCAKLGEAEVMADAGITDILIANQIVGAPKLARLVALASRANVKVAVDSLANCAAIAAEARQAGVTMKLVIENDVGMNRAGVDPDKAPALAAEIAKLQGVRLVGLMAWEAHAVALDDAAKQKTVQDAIARLTRAAEACRAAGHTIEIVSCGGSGTFPYCVRQPGVTEVQCGGAIFSDVMYRSRFHLDFPPALKLLASVTSRPTPTRIILDAGKKAMSSDGAVPEPEGLPPSKPARLSAEHGTVELEEPSDTPAVGDKVPFVVGYGDTTVHLHEEIAAIRNGRVEAIWKVSARGRIR